MTKNRSGEGARPRAAANAAPPHPGEAQKKGGTPPLDLTVAKLTDVGRTRDHNEDYVGFYIPPDPQQQARKGAMYVVADGMGGHQAGEVASQGAVELAIGQYYSDAGADVGTSLVRAFRAANRQIYEQAQADQSRSGMGTTLVAAVVLGRKVYVASVGDSRAYLVNQKGIRQITEDHSWVGEQVRMGLLTPEDARRHPQRNVVTRALGSRPTVEVDLFEGEIGEGDHLLLCTDGVTGHLEDQELAAVLQSHAPEEAARKIVAQANERGGHDNMGIVIVSAHKAASAAAPAPVAAPAAAPAAVGAARQRRRVSPLVGVLAAVAVVAVLVASGLGAWWLLGNRPTPVAMTVVLTTTIPGETLMPGPSPTAGETWGTGSPGVTPSVPVAVLETEEPGTPLATDGSPVEPTATLAPTHTSGPLPPSPGTPVPTRTRVPTRTPEPKATPYPAPSLESPESDAELDGTREFVWRWGGAALGQDHYFDLRIWSEIEEARGSEPRGVIPLTKDTRASVDLDSVQSIKEFRDRTKSYYWGVVVVRKACVDCRTEIVGQWSEERGFIYAGPSSPEGPEDPGPVEPPASTEAPPPSRPTPRP